MSTQSSKQRLTPESYTVALICPNEVVMSAVRFMLDEEHQKLPKNKRDLSSYILGSMSGHNVVIATHLGKVAGDVATASIAAFLLHSFPKAELRLMVSIAGGVPKGPHGIRLGDVVVSDPNPKRGGVAKYDYGKCTTDGFERKVHYLEATPAPLIEACMHMKHDHRTNPSRIADILLDSSNKYPRMSAFRRPPPLMDPLSRDLNERAVRQNAGPGHGGFGGAMEPPQVLGQPRVHYGMIASGASLVTDSKERDKLAEEFGAICLDTDASGLQIYPALVVSGIYHYCDPSYSDSWIEYAAASAAACAKNMLSFIAPTGNGYQPYQRRK
ncbi:nucleoside phosphorylase domain-containing protein [Aspergillus heterothallicus]